MVPGAVVLAAGGAIGMGAGKPIDRHMLREEHRFFTESEVMVGQNVIALLVCTAIVLPLWSLFGGRAPLSNPTVFWGAVVTLFLANVGVQIGGLFASRYADVSLTLPYQAVTPGILTLAVFVIGERPSAWGYAGIATIALGTYIHGRIGCGSFLAYFTPFWRLAFLPKIIMLLAEDRAHLTETRWSDYLHHLPKELDKTLSKRIEDGEKRLGRTLTLGEKRQLLLKIAYDERKGVRFALLSAFCGTFGLLSEAMMARHGNPAFGLANTFLLLVLFSIFWNRVIVPSTKNPGAGLAPFRERLGLHGNWFFLKGLCQTAAFFLPMVANRLAPVAYVGTFKRLAIPIGIFISKKFFGEDVLKGRWITTGIITAGAVILVVDNAPAKIVDFMSQLFGSHP